MEQKNPPEDQRLVIDLADGRIWHGEQELELTRLEYAVVAYLGQHAGRIVSYAELWQEVWAGFGAVGKGERNTVRAVVKRLRPKLGARGDDFLVVKRGVGVLLKRQGVEVRGR